MYVRADVGDGVAATIRIGHALASSVKDDPPWANAGDEVRTVPGTGDPLNIIECNRALGPNTVSSLAVSPFSDDISFLRHKFEEANWKLYVARTIRGALMQLSRVRVSIVICERQLPDGNSKLMADSGQRRSTKVLLIYFCHALSGSGTCLRDRFRLAQLDM
jgi:hypothetical protein